MTSRHYAVMSLLKNGIDSLPVTVEQIEKILTNQGWSIINYDPEYSKHAELLKAHNIYALARRVKAFTYKSADERCVFIRSDLSNNDRRLLLAHELGHIELGHLPGNNILGYTPGGLIDNGQEDEANSFALEFLAPICVLDRRRITAPMTISSVTLLDYKRCRMVSDEIKNHARFTEHELKLCDAFETKAVPKNQRKTTLLCVIISLLIALSISISAFTIIGLQGSRTMENRNVVITKSGDCYHRPGCWHIRDKDNITEISIDEAQNMGYVPCEDCIPE